jgi:hypothetical protein
MHSYKQNHALAELAIVHTWLVGVAAVAVLRSQHSAAQHGRAEVVRWSRPQPVSMLVMVVHLVYQNVSSTPFATAEGVVAAVGPQCALLPRWPVHLPPRRPCGCHARDKQGSSASLVTKSMQSVASCTPCAPV